LTAASWERDVATVHLPANWATATGGTLELTIDAARVADVMRTIAARFPALAPELATMAVAIDGEIHADAEYIDLTPESEIHLVPRVSGGSFVTTEDP
jgi:molybdopterin converting factor small subunit